MALNWNPFLPDESLSFSNDHQDQQWCDLAQPPAGPTDMSSTSSAARAVANYETALNNTAGDPYLTDTAFFNPNDYFLGDFEILQPFGDTTGGGASTSESSPEDTTSLAYTGQSVFEPVTMSPSSQTPPSTSSPSGHSPAMPSVSNPVIMQREPRRRQAFPNPLYEAMFPNSINAGFVEDLTFPAAPNGLPCGSKTTADTSTQDQQANTTMKRNKGDKPDQLTACWASPLCPNHDQDGPPPNPSTCGGGCAPFLFAPGDNSPIDGTMPQQEETPEGEVEIKSRPKKRTESDVAADDESSGRQFPSNTTDIQPRFKNEASTTESPEQDKAADDEKPKGRRRLPHNQVERKYRESLNTQLESLRRVVPALQQSPRSCDSPDIEDLPTPSKPSKAVILASATAYIKQTEKEKKALAEENLLLKARVKALQALVKCEDCSLMQYVMDLKIQPPPR